MSSDDIALYADQMPLFYDDFTFSQGTKLVNKVTIASITGPLCDQNIWKEKISCGSQAAVGYQEAQAEKLV